MGAEPQPGLTVILGRARAGDERARDELIALVYDELRRVASGLMRRERPEHTLSSTAVVHEAVIRLLGEAVFDREADRSYLAEHLLLKRPCAVKLIRAGDATDPRAL